MIQPERLPAQITNYSQTRVSSDLQLPEEGINLTAHLDQLEKTYVLEALKRTDGNQTNAAELLKMSVRSLRHLLDKHGIRGLTAQMRDERRSDTIPRRRAAALKQFPAAAPMILSRAAGLKISIKRTKTQARPPAPANAPDPVRLLPARSVPAFGAYFSARNAE
jgi:hypothetical protein